MKKITVWILVLAIPVLFWGCQPNTLKMLDSYMDKRYPNAGFTVDHNELVSYDKEYHITDVYYSNSQFPDGEIRAHVMLQNGQWVYSDNYLMLLRENEIRGYMQEKAEDKFGTCKVYVNYLTMYLPSTVDVNASAEEILDACNVEVIIYLPPGDLEKAEYEKLTDEFWKELIKDQHTNVFGTVWMIDSKPLYNSLAAPFSAVEMDKYASENHKVGSFGQFPY